MPKFRNDSIFGPGRRVPLDREQRAQFKARLLLQRRPGRLTIAAATVGRVLVDMMGQDGRLDPSLDRIAELARVHRATAVRALAQLRAFGFVEWTRRLIRTAATGWRCEQTSSAFVLRVPACEAQFAPQVSLVSSKKTTQDKDGGWEAQVANATRMLLALGAPVPLAWGPSSATVLR